MNPPGSETICMLKSTKMMLTVGLHSNTQYLTVNPEN